MHRVWLLLLVSQALDLVLHLTIMYQLTRRFTFWTWPVIFCTNIFSAPEAVFGGPKSPILHHSFILGVCFSTSVLFNLIPLHFSFHLCFIFLYSPDSELLVNSRFTSLSCMRCTTSLLFLSLLELCGPKHPRIHGYDPEPRPNGFCHIIAVKIGC